jgi:Transposase
VLCEPASKTRLTDLYGVGPIIAASVLGRWVLLKDPATWTEQQQREQIAELRKARHLLFRAWVLKEELRDLYRLPPADGPMPTLTPGSRACQRPRIPAVAAEISTHFADVDWEMQPREIRALAASRECVVGSVHALTEGGSLLIASASSSQLGRLASCARHVMLVVRALLQQAAATRYDKREHSPTRAGWTLHRSGSGYVTRHMIYKTPPSDEPVGGWLEK